MQSWKGAGMQRCGDADLPGLQGCRDPRLQDAELERTQGCGDIEMQGCRAGKDAGVQRCRDADLPGLQGFRDTDMQGSEAAGCRAGRLQGCRDAGIQGCRGAELERTRDAGTQKCRDAELQDSGQIQEPGVAGVQKWKGPRDAGTEMQGGRGCRAAGTQRDMETQGCRSSRDAETQE